MKAATHLFPLSLNPSASLLGSANAVLNGTSRQYHVPDFEGCLSIKSVSAGCAVWQAGGRRFAVRDNCFLILNDRQHYTLDIRSRRPTTTFCLFFARGFVEDVWRGTILPHQSLLDAPQAPAGDPPAGFFERLEPESSPVLSEVRRFQRAIGAGLIDAESWDESFFGIAAALVQAQRQVLCAAARLPAARAATRMELCRRLLRGRDLLLSSWDQPLQLRELAAGACLSPYHFHRMFTRLFGRTPHRFLTDYRLERVTTELRQSDRSILDLCLAAGFQSPTSFSSLFHRRYGMSPRAYRRAKSSEAISQDSRRTRRPAPARSPGLITHNHGT